MSDGPRADPPLPPPNRVQGLEEIWDRFIDDLDRAGQRGSPADVVVPSLGGSALAGKRFGDLTKDDLKVLSRVGSSAGRRSDTIITLWNDMQQRARGPRKGRRT